MLDDRTVSRTHGAIVVSGGRCVLSDSDSTSGTFVRDSGKWRRISSAVVSLEDRVRFGAYVITVEELLSLAEEATESPARSKIERDPETGQIVKRSR